jgi:hypothetical protein
MKTSSINYLFPPDEIANLPTWRFILHFQSPAWFSGYKTSKALAALRACNFKAVQFPLGLENAIINQQEKTVGVAIEVTEERRSLANSLADYESDVWMIYGNMIQHGFGDLFYEAMDWQG